MTEPQASGSTGEETSETPGYTSPTEQFRETLAKFGIPFMGLPGFFENLTKASHGGSGGGGFEFSLEEMRELHRQFKEEADAFERMREKARITASDLRKLADDPASSMHHEAATKHLNFELRPAINQQAKFARGFEIAVGKALGIKEESEAAGAEAAKGVQKAL